VLLSTTVTEDGDGSLFPVVEVCYRWWNLEMDENERDVLFWFVCFLHQFFFGV